MERTHPGSSVRSSAGWRRASSRATSACSRIWCAGGRFAGRPRTALLCPNRSTANGPGCSHEECRHQECRRKECRRMKIVAAGASGFLGTRLTAALTAAGHQVTRLVRSDPKGPDESLWNPHSGDLDTSVFDGTDAVINLCGAGVAARRWTNDYKYLLTSSRVNPTRLLASECARLGIPVLINAS